MHTKTRRYYFYYLLKIGVFLARLLPMKAAYSLGKLLGIASFLLIGRYRRRTLEHLRQAFPLKSEKEIRRIAINAYSNVIANYIEFIHFYKLNKDNIDSWITFHGLDKINKVLSQGKGLIGLTAHFGNWELIGPCVKIKGYEGATIARKIYFYKYDKYLKKLRSASSINVIYREESPKKILNVLKENKILGMLADQDIDNIEGVFVDFFGRPAYTPTAPARLAMTSGAPLVPCYMLRNGNKYDCFIEEPIFVEAGKDKEEAIKYYTQKWTNVLESYIKKYPEQWVWMHRRWKTKKNEV